MDVQSLLFALSSGGQRLLVALFLAVVFVILYNMYWSRNAKTQQLVKLLASADEVEQEILSEHDSKAMHKLFDPTLPLDILPHKPVAVIGKDPIPLPLRENPGRKPTIISWYRLTTEEGETEDVFAYRGLYFRKADEPIDLDLLKD